MILYLIAILFILGGLFLSSCNGKISTIVNNPPISTGTMPITKDGPVYELSIGEVTEQIKSEAYSLSIDSIRELPFGKELVTKEGILKRQVRLGQVVRLYSLNNNSVSIDDFEHAPIRNNTERTIATNSMIRDYSDYYMATVNVEGIGTVGYVLVPVYSVYKGWHEINWISYNDLLENKNQNSSELANSISSGIGELNNRMLGSILPNAVVDKYLYYFINSDAEVKIVRIVQKDSSTYLFSELDGTWYSVENAPLNVQDSQGSNKFEFVIGEKYVNIKRVEILK